MYPLHDKDLDRLSRDAAEHYEVDSGPSGWEQLEKRLDQELPQQRGRRRFLFWLFFIVVTTGSALTGLLITSQPVTPLAASVRVTEPVRQEPAALNKTTEAQNKTNNPIADQGTAGHSIDRPVTEAGKQPPGATAEAITIPLNDKQGTIAGPGGETVPPSQLQNSTTNKPVTIGSNNKAVQPRNKRGNNTLTAPISAQPFGLNRQRSIKNNLAKKPAAINDKNDQPFDRSNNVNAAQDKNHNNQEVTTTQEPVTTPVTTEPANEAAAPSNTTQSVAATDSAAAPAIDKKEPTQKKTPSSKQPLELGLVAGPDVSMVEFGPLYKGGYNVGLQIGYRISDRWSVNTGIIYTKKFYKATGDQFKAPKHSTPSYYDIDKLEGFCDMWDIPVNVRYDFSFTDKRRFFGSAGVSSYLMNRQYYEYYYWYQGNYDNKEIDWKENDKDLFSILNLSVGYERKFSDHFSIQAEPYLKVPLKGLGYGSMKMGSYGIFFSLKYRPTFGSKNTATKK